ncbi:putative lipid II flippase FtsW [Parvibium lacunae]|uniref:Probable peptidoglycan glycosyltransferase FtsW n=1 Tax=Parvibium lacunae TaxID=1888893 RepID=A0A368L1Z0_9BURK|nr:putative lipid II flippase FtsW [Parvibium lacunae]
MLNLADFKGKPDYASESLTAIRPARNAMPDYDSWLLWAVLALLLLGMVMVYSASIALPDSPKYANYKSTHFLMRHCFSLLVGFIAAVLAFQIPLSVWQRLAPLLFLAVLVLLVLVLIPGIGKGVNGARRWISLYVLNIQPSELMKLCCVMYAADYTVRKQEVMQYFKQGFLPMAAAMMLVGMLLLLEPDMGAFMVIVAIAFGILFLGGVNGKLFGGLILTLTTTFLMLIWFSPWRRERIFAYLNPWEEKNALGKAYQLSHSLIAFGRGEWTGVGLGGSVEKLHYLPEAHTDFLLAVIGEELGLVGVVCVILLFFFIIKRAFDIGDQAIALDRVYAGLVAKGVGLWLGAQAFINMGVNLGLLPTKGLTLPLMSYGGSGILVNCIAVAVLLRVDAENRGYMRGSSRAASASHGSAGLTYANLKTGGRQHGH